MPMRKIMVVPCIVNIVLYWFAVSTVPFGCASCMRISSASIPPTHKNSMAVTPYMIPIFLWSTVVNQLQKPVVERGRRKMSTRRVGTVVVTASETVVIDELPGCAERGYDRRASFLRQEVVGDGLGLLRGHRLLTLGQVPREARHADTRGRWRLEAVL